jgi:DNA ligase-1
MLFADVVATSAAVTATRSRTAKIEALAALLNRCSPKEIAAVVGFLTGVPRQGRIGVGWATLVDARSSALMQPTIGGALTVGEIDDVITAVGATSGAGSASARRRALADIFARASEDETDFAIRLLGGELHQGALAGLMADAIAKAAGVPAPAVRRATMLGGDLGETAVLAVTGGAEQLAQVHLELLRPIQPMLAASSPDVAAAIDETGEASVEWKLDGARIQVHRAGDDVRVFTRNLNDVTARLPEVVALAHSLPAHSFLLDGETIGVADGERPPAFQDTMSRFGRDHAASHALTLSAFFFDIVHLDGADLLDAPLHERIAALESIAAPFRVPAIRTTDTGAAAAFLAGAIDSGHEGVMVKAIDSRYDAGRRGGSWRKVKPVRTLDLVVLAAEWGHGRRRGWLSNLHLGARGERDGEFVMVGKTFKGMTDELLAWQTDELQRIAIGSADGHVVTVRPELVVEIALDGVQVSPRYAGGVALRFARLRGYRPDKSVADADTIDAVRAMLPDARSG